MIKSNSNGNNTDHRIILQPQPLYPLSNGLPQCFPHNLVRMGIVQLVQQNAQVHVVEMGISNLLLRRRCRQCI